MAEINTTDVESGGLKKITSVGIDNSVFDLTVQNLTYKVDANDLNFFLRH